MRPAKRLVCLAVGLPVGHAISSAQAKLEWRCQSGQLPDVALGDRPCGCAPAATCAGSGSSRRATSGTFLRRPPIGHGVVADEIRECKLAAQAAIARAQALRSG